MSHDLDNISIELEDSLFDKPDSELTQQLYEMARRIAESDRNNQAYRQAKKSKTTELDSLTKNKIQLENELRILEEELDSRKKKENQNIMGKKNRRKFEEVEEECVAIGQKQKQIQANAANIGRENDKLEKKIAALQIQYEIMVKQNRHKTNVLSKLNKQKEQKMQRIRVNQEKIQELEDQCEQTKKRAEDLENQLRQEIQTERELDELITDRQALLEKQKLQQEETSRKQQESKRAINKMINSAKALETEIQMKFKEAQKLQYLHASLRQKILSMQQQQKQLDDFMSRRRQILQSLKQMSSKATREEEALQKMKDSSEFE